MEFIDGITVCSDCGGPLVESEEIAKEMQKQEKAKQMRRAQAMPTDRRRPQQAPAAPKAVPVKTPMRQPQPVQAQAAPKAAPVRTMTPEEEAKAMAALQAAVKASQQPTKLYVDKAQKYEDLKSSASAFLIVGGILLVASILCWLGIVNLPMYGLNKYIFQGALTAMGIFSIAIYINSVKDAKELAPQIDAEKNKTQELVNWFLENFTAEGIDARILHRSELAEEELSLIRFQVIQHFLITQKEITDPSYLDLLCEEIYSRLYES